MFICHVINELYYTGYDDVLSDIELIYMHNNADIDHILICGDLNTDITRQKSPHTQAINEFCERLSLSMCFYHPAADIDYTYKSRVICLRAFPARSYRERRSLLSLRIVLKEYGCKNLV